MVHEIKVPRLGWSMEEGVLVEWLKHDGDVVRSGDPLFLLEGEKAVQEIESIDAGILRIPEDRPSVGSTVAVGAVIGFLLAPGESLPAASTPPREEQGGAADARFARTSAFGPAAASPSARRRARELRLELATVATSEPDPRAERREKRPATVAPRSLRGDGRAKISPRAARVAAELGVDWSGLAGSGKSGRIRECDIRAAAEQGPRPLADARADRPETAPAGSGLLRRTIAERMSHSLRNTAPVTLTTRVDATNLVGLRAQFRHANAALVPSYTDIIAKLAASALLEHPRLNARWESERLVSSKAVHIGIAIDAEEGLFVPVVRDVSRRSLTELTRITNDLSERARDRRLSAEEMQGGTFTITNLGAHGIDAFTPIINWPETAILGLGVIRRDAVVGADDAIEAGWRITLSLTFDHRALDGAPAARFLDALRTRIENPAAWLLSDN